MFAGLVTPRRPERLGRWVEIIAVFSSVCPKRFGLIRLGTAVKGDFFSTVLLGEIIGACLRFPRHNWSPATIFMGDAGSLTLGYVLATLTVHGSTKSSAAVAILVPVLALGVLVIDTLLVMAVRFLERSQSGLLRRITGMFAPDRGHLHHLLLDLRLHRRAVVRWIYFLVLIYCGGALAVALTKSRPLGLVLVVVEIVVIMLVRHFGLARRAETLGAALRREVLEDIEAGPEVLESDVS